MSKDVEFKGTTPEQEAAFMRGMGRSPDHPIDPTVFPRNYRKRPLVIQAYKTLIPVDIVTLEGTMHADPGDYIITGVKGESYPCKPDIFEASYELVTESDS